MLKTGIIAGIVALFVGAAGVSFVTTNQASAQAIKSNLCKGSELSLSQGDCDEKVCTERNAAGECIKREDRSATDKLNGLITSIVNIFSVIVGIVAVIMVIFSGFKYITSGGDSGKISSAKTTLIYAIVGLIIVALAQVIVRFVLSKV